MKLLSLTGLLMLTGMFGAPIVIAQETYEGSHGKVVNKHMNGVINLLTSGLEIPVQYYRGRERGINGLQDHPFLSKNLGAMWGGIWHGPISFAGRAWSGLNQLGGAWLLSASDNEKIGIPLDTKYVYDLDIPEKKMVPEKLHLMYNKGERGVMHLLWGGFVEVPEKTVNGIKDGKPLTGFFKGTYYMTSRIWNGMYEFGGAFLPGFSTTEGMVFKTDEPWK